MNGFDHAEFHESAEVPAAALRLNATVELGERSSDDTQTAPVRLRARSGDPIDHWYWGKIAHDLSGYKLTGNKNRLALLYDHVTPIGYALRKNIDTTEGDMNVNGTLVSARNDSTAQDVIDWMSAGIPMEASISFAGGDLELEQVAEGATAEVNGKKFKGPGVIVRKWQLREVSIVTSGADANTESALLSNNSDSVSVTFTKKESDMSQETKTVPVDEVKEANASETVELTADTDSSDAADIAAVEEQNELSVADILKPYRELGEGGLELAAEGVSIDEAKTRMLQQKEAQIEQLRKENAALRASGGGEDEAASASHANEPEGELQQGGKFPPYRKLEDARQRKYSRH